MLLADTHAHLDAPAFLDDIDAVLARAQESGVERILTVGSDLATSERAVEIAQRFEIVFAAVGIHPHEVGRFDAEAEAVRMLLEETGVVAIGEVGLDYHWHPETGEAQREAFRTQLAWARERHLPVSVHNRDADDDLLTALGGSDTVVVLHCFSGNLALAESALDSGYYVSFAGNVTFPRAHELREVAARVPGNRLLTETDSPVLAPQAHRGRRNEPLYVSEVLLELARVRETPAAELSERLVGNADEVFRWRRV